MVVNKQDFIGHIQSTNILCIYYLFLQIIKQDIRSEFRYSEIVLSSIIMADQDY